ncbi:MAG TPA: hypothetical protein VFC70_01990 [Oscillospiraceae bacterium]|nr:hypothetical protein [Oscillospiraceae bacterium]
MKIYILGEVLEYENRKDNIDNIFDKINRKVSASNLILSHLIVDEYELYNDFYDYFLDNIKHIEEIKVVTKTIIETSREVILCTMNYVEKMIPGTEILSYEFYKVPDEDSWNRLANLIEGINWIIDGFVSIDLSMELKNIVNNYEQWNLYAKNIYLLREILIEFEQIFENGDLISIADILFYEMVPIFEDMEERLEKIIGEYIF